MSDDNARAAAPETARTEGRKHVHRTGKRYFVRHYLEMVAAMLVGMLVLGGIVRGAAALAGVEYTMDLYPEVMTLEMAATMALGMAAWMRFRGHAWPGTLEMSGAMFVPAIVLIPLLWAGVLNAGSLMLAEHVVMFPLMLLVMLRRRAEYGL
jgi:hypothetical protein